jgi:hypothetical protein
LPLYPGLGEAQVELVATALEDALAARTPALATPS